MAAIIWAVKHNHTQREKKTLINMHPRTSTTQGWICLWGGSSGPSLIIITYLPSKSVLGQHSTCQQSLQGPWCFLWGKTLNFLLTSNRAATTLVFCPICMWCRLLYTTVGPYTYRNGSTIHIYPAQYALSQIFWSWKKMLTDCCFVYQDEENVACVHSIN